MNLFGGRGLREGGGGRGEREGREGGREAEGRGGEGGEREREGKGGRGRGRERREGKDNEFVVSVTSVIGMFNSNPMIPQYLNNNLT